jgi:Spy/CpxP family protein refolding chaperone
MRQHHRKNFWKFAAVALLAIAGTTGVIWAQGRPFGPGFGGPERMIRFLTDYLDLTPGQQELLKTQVEQTKGANEATAAQLRQIAEQARAAVKAGKSDAELQQIANSAAPLVAQLAGSHLKSMSKVYAALSQPQKDKLERLHDQVHDRIRQRRGMRLGH